MSISYTRGDFGKRLLDGGWVEAYIADLLRAHGVRCELTATGFLRPEGARPEDYADVDLIVWDAGGIERKVSIKSTRYAFTGPQDYPYPDCLLMSVQAGQDPLAYWATIRVSVNEATKWGKVVAPHVRVTTRQQGDRERAGDYTVAVVPRSVLRPWSAFVAALALEEG